MTQMSLWGNIFIIYSAPLALFWFNVRKSSKLVIILISSAFLWLVAALLTAVVWVAVPPLKDDYWFALIASVLLQELFRYLWWRLLRRTEHDLSILSPDGDVVITREKLAMVSGLGYGLMSSTMMTCNLLDIMSGPGILAARGCTDHSHFTISSTTAAMIGLTHVFWGIIAFSGWDIRRARRGAWSSGDLRVLYVFFTHLFVSLLTLNNEHRGTCAGTMVPIALVMIASGIFAWFAAGVRFKRSE
ncbi:uncharacterized protein MONBRDRAFT_32302 [Monosiga brevicollis MX1]|uniref:Gamma-secretase subunit Aph-1 n=1 Tax=Monosiga brevicollis TaxID=81824 RepID=A9UYN8_MONBE|nr:uncharacterized protein MONBRDRAFT_32302 [Monosiga brevicollis MX1]EDQ89497.1 predicted protein [Monosiga brevicollis MX1]|eukprot:XP_001745526.1 hypothetical protein [Monosiga brevicollis MX1]